LMWFKGWPPWICAKMSAKVTSIEKPKCTWWELSFLMATNKLDHYILGFLESRLLSCLNLMTITGKICLLDLRD
jgi:hypothetical protein